MASVRMIGSGLAVVGALAVLVLAVSPARSVEPSTASRPLAHMVFFTLKDHSAGSRERFVASCKKHLTDHEGATFFAIGTMAEDVDEGEVSVRDFDVSLHVVFSSREAEARYLKHPRHLAFVAENKEHFAKVRVFDSYVVPTP